MKQTILTSPHHDFLLCLFLCYCLMITFPQKLNGHDFLPLLNYCCMGCESNRWSTSGHLSTCIVAITFYWLSVSTRAPLPSISIKQPERVFQKVENLFPPFKNSLGIPLLIQSKSWNAFSCLQVTTLWIPLKLGSHLQWLSYLSSYSFSSNTPASFLFTSNLCMLQLWISSPLCLECLQDLQSLTFLVAFTFCTIIDCSRRPSPWSTSSKLLLS